MFAKTQDEVRRIYDSVDTVKRLSDRIIGIGPINIIGLDGILAWVPIPGLGTAYSVLAGAFILFQGLRARCDATTLAAAFLALLVDAGVSLGDTVIPIIGSTVDTFFQGHLYAAHMIQKDIEKTLYIEGSASLAHRDGSHQDNIGEMRHTKGKKRLVYLGN
jgi:hypothetical protein